MQEFLARLQRVKPSKDGYTALCPAHDDRRPSLSVTQTTDGTILVRCHAGCRLEEIVRAMGLEIRDLFPESKRVSQAQKRETGPTFDKAMDALRELRRRFGRKEEAIYTYTNAAGEPVGVVVRFRTDMGKEIRPISRVGDGWQLAGMPAPRPLYRLQDILKAEEGRSVWVFEGEKCVEAAAAIGILATTSSGGSNAASKTDWTPLRGREVVIVPDNDAAGRKYAVEVAGLVRAVGAVSARILDLARHAPGLPEGGDIADLLADPNYFGLLDQGGLPADEPRDAESVKGMLYLLAATVDEFTGQEAACLAITTVSAVEPREIPWLWYGRIPCGRLSLFVGRPGAGKSFLICDLAARISVGGPWPDGGYAPRGDVLLLSAEDDVADTIRPRLDACGADCNRIHVLQGRKIERDGKEKLLAVTLEDVEAIDAAVRRLPQCRLVVVDPVGSFLGPGIDTHRDNEVRASLAPLVHLLSRKEVALILVCHVRKATAAYADDLTLGSRAFVGLARSVWHILVDPEDRSRKLFLAGKSNLCAPPLGLAFRIEGIPPQIVWEDVPVDINVDEVVTGSGRGRPNNSRQKAEDFLLDLLKDGPKRYTEILSKADQNGITESSLRRAARSLGVKAERKGVPPFSVWSLPDWEGEGITSL